MFTHLVGERAAELNDILTQGGFRRSQSIAYRPACETCRACVSVRVLAQEFDPRPFRRQLAANEDLVGYARAAVPSAEQYSLFRAYLDARHADGGMADMSVLDYAMMVEDSIIDTFVTEYRARPQPGAKSEADKQPLLGVALCDRLSDGISMVYSFYDPDLLSRSLGTYLILDHIERARKLRLAYVYLGYWVEGARKMHYKSRFRPQERLMPEGWARVD